MTDEQLNEIKEVSSNIKLLECTISILSNGYPFDYSNTDKSIIIGTFYKFRNDLLPILEDKLKEYKEKFKNL